MNLKKIREQKGLKQEDIANILNIDRSKISKLENGKQNLNSQQIIDICKTLKISADYLLGLVDQETK